MATMMNPIITNKSSIGEQQVDTIQRAMNVELSSSALDGAQAAYVPSADQLLFLFAQASKAHDGVSKSVGEKMQAAISAKNGMTNISNEMQTMKFDDKGNADGTKVIKAIEDLQKTAKNPDVVAALQKAHDIATVGDDKGINRDEMKKIDGIVSSTNETIDSDMQQKTMHLKQENDYFSGITSLVKEIMDSNTKIFSTIMARG